MCFYWAARGIHLADYEESGLTRRRWRRQDCPMGTLFGWTAALAIMGSVLALVVVALSCVAAVVATQRARRVDEALHDDLEKELVKILRHPATQEHPSY